MRKTQWLKKGIYGLAWSFILFAGIRILSGGILESTWWKSFTRSVTGAAFWVAAPASAYIMEEEMPDTMAEFMIRMVRGTVPVWEYAGRWGTKNYGIQDPFYTEHAAIERIERETEEKKDMLALGENQADASIIEQNPDIKDVQALPSDIFAPAVIGSQYSIAKLSDYDFLVRNFYVISEITTITSSELNAKTLLEKDLTIKENIGEPQILIYHTHYSENFVDSREGVEEDSVVGVGSYLASILSEHYGYSVYHDKTPYDMMNGTLDRSKAYDYASEGLEKILDQYPSIEVIIDLHRDGVNEGVHLVTEVNGKPTAQIMFVNGISRSTMQGDIPYLYNPYIQDNLAFSLMLQLKAKAYYPDFTRRILINAYRYNLHFRPRSILVETGAQTNTLEEAMNAMEPLAVMLHEILSGGEHE